jgi:hypothetical protein
LSPIIVFISEAIKNSLKLVSFWKCC